MKTNIRINITPQEYKTLASTPLDKRIIQVGDKLYKIDILCPLYLKAHYYEPTGIIGTFREERDNAFATHQEWAKNK